MLKLFPIPTRAKGPPVYGWQRAATAEASAQRALALRYPDCNWGVLCDGLVVVDVDPRSGGNKTFDLLDLEFGFPPTFTVRTPSRGQHLYYRTLEGVQARNSAGLLGPGVDTKGAGGYVVAAGSRTEAGEYVVALDLPIAPAPQWLIDRITVAERQKEKGPAVDVADATPATVDRAIEWLAKQPSGEGAYATACRLRDFGLSSAQAHSLMQSHDPRPNVPEKVAHAYTYAQNSPGAAISKPEDFELIEEAPAPTPTAAAPKARRLLDFAQAEAKSARYLIKGLLSRQSYAMIYGPPGTGKSFLALDLAYHVAAGREWHGHRAKAGPALYLAYEGVGGMHKRAQALVQHYGGTDVPLYIQPASYDLRAGEGRRALAKDIAALPEKPSLIVFDTFAHALMGGDENSAQDVGAFNTGIAALIKATGACVLILHHPRKAGDSARGSSALLGAVDTEINVDDRVIKPTKQRDMELGAPIGFVLKPIIVGLDEDDEAITSCVVMPATISPAATDRVKALKGKFKLAWEVLCEKRPNNAPITDEEWRQACTEFIGTRRQAWYETKRRLLKDRLIVETEGLYRRKLE